MTHQPPKLYNIGTGMCIQREGEQLFVIDRRNRKAKHLAGPFDADDMGRDSAAQEILQRMTANFSPARVEMMTELREKAGGESANLFQLIGLAMMVQTKLPRRFIEKCAHPTGAGGEHPW